MQFEDLEIIEPILKALKDQNYITPTSIQEKAIPLILNRNDVIGSAQTGTGKTAAFAIPILQHLYLDHKENQQRGDGQTDAKREKAFEGVSYHVWGNLLGECTLWGRAVRA